jgi:uncharacterized protein (DUF885 family)
MTTTYLGQKIPIFLENQLEELKEKYKEIDNFCKDKNFYNGQREEKINKIIEEMKDINKTQKEALKQLLIDSESRDEKISKKVDRNEKDINDIKLAIAKMPWKITKNISILFTCVSILLILVLNFQEITILIKDLL